jgi:hypothetical protein
LSKQERSALRSLVEKPQILAWRMALVMEKQRQFTHPIRVVDSWTRQNRTTDPAHELTAGEIQRREIFRLTDENAKLESSALRRNAPHFVATMPLRDPCRRNMGRNARWINLSGPRTYKLQPSPISTSWSSGLVRLGGGRPLRLLGEAIAGFVIYHRTGSIPIENEFARRILECMAVVAVPYSEEGIATFIVVIFNFAVVLGTVMICVSISVIFLLRVWC